MQVSATVDVVPTAAQALSGPKVLTTDLQTLDQLPSDSLALFCAQPFAPLRGVAGFVDWRVCGAVSRALLSGVFKGEFDEVLLLPARGRLFGKKLFVFGLGDIRELDSQKLRAICQKAAIVLRQARVQQVVFAAPSVADQTALTQNFLSVVQSELSGEIDLVLVSNQR